jgi:predicted amidohydrolase
MNSSSPVLSVAQLPMFWTRPENVAAMLAAIEASAKAGAQIVVLSELAMTGFHREIGREADASTLPSDIAAIQHAARRHRVAVVFGAPTFEAGEERPFNSHLHLGPDGAIQAVVSKRGLTPSEATFFSAGRSRPSSRLFGAACSSVLCREVEDLQAIAEDFGDATPDVVFWPSFIGRPASEPEDGHYRPLACQMAGRLGCHVVQANWPESLNVPDTLNMGESAVIAPDGELLFALPRNASGLAVFRLGDRQYRWMPLPA